MLIRIDCIVIIILPVVVVMFGGRSDGEGRVCGDEEGPTSPLIYTQQHQQRQRQRHSSNNNDNNSHQQQQVTPSSSSPLVMGGEDTIITSPLVGTKPARVPQYVTAFSATLGAFAMGTVLGFSSPAGARLIDPDTPDFLHLTKDQNSWFSSLMNVGALLGGPVGGLCLNKLGRRGTLLASVVPFIAGWCIIAFAQNFVMLVIGRVLTGLCTGVVSISVPTYIAEYSSSDIRGTLGSSFQLMVTLGILYSFILGAVLPWRWLAAVCNIPIIVHALFMFNAKESPNYLLFKGKDDQAKDALQYFRGKESHIQTELDMLRAAVEERRHNNASFSDLLKPHVLKPFIVSLGLMFFQQFSGANAVLFNMATIFDTAGSKLSDDLSSIIVILVQAVSTFLATVLMDKAGRKLLLIASSSVMALSLVALGEFFYWKTVDESWATNTLGWLPLLSLMSYEVAFSVGYGPIPWLMMGELFPPDVKELATGQATMFLWSLAFLVTFIFTPMQAAIGDAWVYWILSGMCVVNLVFCVSVVPETKGKTLDEITALFGGPTTSSSSNQQRRNSSDC